jgi:hypothetical protein
MVRLFDDSILARVCSDPIISTHSFFHRLRAVIADYAQQSRFRPQIPITSDMTRAIDDLNSRLHYFESSYLVRRCVSSGIFQSRLGSSALQVQSTKGPTVSLALLRHSLPVGAQPPDPLVMQDVKWDRTLNIFGHEPERDTDRKQRILAWAENVLMNRVSISSSGVYCSFY